MRPPAIALALCLPALAHANNNDLIRDANALVHGKEVVMYCEPCGDPAPGIPFVAQTDVADLAHAYVRTAPDRFENVALLVGLETDGPPSLRQSIETADGVLITPSHTPVTAMRAEPPPPPAPPATLSETVHHHHATLVYQVPSQVPWLAIAALAAGIGFGLGVGVTLGVIALRRRRAMAPRAVNLDP